MGRGGAVATNSKPDDSCFGFDNENLAWTFFSAVAALIALLCFGMIEFFTGSGKLPSSDQCAQSPQFMNYVGNDMIPGGVAIADTQGQPGTLQCCQKCSVMPGAVMWVYHTPIAIDGTDMCFCKSKIGTGEANQQYIGLPGLRRADQPPARVARHGYDTEWLALGWAAVLGRRWRHVRQLGLQKRPRGLHPRGSSLSGRRGGGWWWGRCGRLAVAAAGCGGSGCRDHGA
jgi:hypothetical protein